MMVNTLYAYVYDLYLLLLSRSSHSLNYIFGSTNFYIEPANHLLVHDIDISLPTLYEHSTCLLYANSFDNPPYSKSKKFLETKVAAIKLRGFNHS
jgi:hypothetical protein